MKTDAPKAGIRTDETKLADEAHITARWGRPWRALPNWTEIARVDRRAELILYPLVCGCGLFAIAAHFYSAVPAAHQIEWTWRECLRLVGHS